MFESVIDLHRMLCAAHYKSRLFTFYTKDEYALIESLLRNDTSITALSFNSDFTEYSRSRDLKIAKIATKLGRRVITSADDITLHPFSSIIPISSRSSHDSTSTSKAPATATSDEVEVEEKKEEVPSHQSHPSPSAPSAPSAPPAPYLKFAPYYNNAIAKSVVEPSKLHLGGTRFINAAHHLSFEISLDDIVPKLYTTAEVADQYPPHQGGRTHALKALHAIGVTTCRDYDTNHDKLAYVTTRLSAFNKFGCISIREAFHWIVSKLGRKSALIRQFIWRDFFYNLHALRHYNESNGKYQNVKWENNKTLFAKWCTGCTGVPVVDACMHELNSTGFMHNRGRLIVSNFLVRLLHIDWKWGAKYFAQHLYDYDPIQNEYGWRISAHCSGIESRPLYQTIMNPWLQSRKYDADAVYIKKWLPVLRDIPANVIHKWNVYCTAPEYKTVYMAPIIDYEKEKKRSLALYN
jgi:deoxyribodipyrimidine photo-lyase